LKEYREGKCRGKHKEEEVAEEEEEQQQEQGLYLLLGYTRR